MVIREKFIMGKSPRQSLCEDGLYIDENFIAVIDGVTSKSNTLYNGATGGRAAMESAIEVMKTASAETTAQELFDGVNSAVAALYNGTPTGEAAVCMIVYSIHRKEIWCIGDCQCIINNTCYTHEKLIDKELSEKRAKIIAEAVKSGISETDIIKNDIGRTEIMSVLKKQHLYANNTLHPYGYPVLNGTPYSPTEITVHSVKPGDLVVLASDGYPRLFPTLQESEEYLEHIIKTDPLCYKEYKSTKGLVEGNLSFDDRTYISFSVK